MVYLGYPVGSMAHIDRDALVKEAEMAYMVRVAVADEDGIDVGL